MSNESREKRPKIVYLIGKRAFDVVFSLIALLCFLPFAILICLVISFSEYPFGSPFYMQTRVGKGGKQFKMFKFRTMYKNADKLLDSLQHLNQKDGPVFKIKNDPRITKVGKILRKTSIDEVPQFINVLLGDMSLVGPRPPLPNEVSQYTEYQKQRLSITPGLTCIWQVHPNRDNISFDEWVEMDLDYIARRSWGLDLKLIAETVGAVFRADGT